MKKQLHLLISIAICAFCAFTFIACDDSSTGPSNDDSRSSSSSISESRKSSEAEQIKSSSSAKQSSSSETAEESSSSETAKSSSSEVKVLSSSSTELIKKVQIAYDDNGIYGISVKMNAEFATEKGEFEMIFYDYYETSGKEEQVLDYFYKYFLNDDGSTYDISTTLNGEIYQNRHKENEFKITETLSARDRPDKVVIYYTPDGGEKTEIFTTTYEEYKATHPQD